MQVDSEIEAIKLRVLDYLIADEFVRAVNYVRDVAPMLGLTGAALFVKKVRDDAGGV